MAQENSSDFKTHRFVFNDLKFCEFSESTLLNHLFDDSYDDNRNHQKIEILELTTNQASFSVSNTYLNIVSILQAENSLILNCSCNHHSENKLCSNQAQALAFIEKKEDFKVFFDEDLRRKYFEREALAYGLAHEADLSQFFYLEWDGKNTNVKPISSSLFAVTKDSLEKLKGIIEETTPQIPLPSDTSRIIVFKQHKYYKHLCIDFYQSALTKEGKPKNPLAQLHPLDFIWETEDQEQIRFFTALQKFQNPVEEKKRNAHLNVLRAIFKNPNAYTVYEHQKEIAESVTASALSRIYLNEIKPDVHLTISLKDKFYSIKARLLIANKSYVVSDITLKHGFFIVIDNVFYLVNNLPTYGLLNLLKKHTDGILIHESKFLEFKRAFLEPLEDQVNVNYQHIKIATPKQLQQHGFNQETEKIIYLSDFGEHVMIIPVMRYGEAEVQIRSRIQVYGLDQKGKEFLVPRDHEEEIKFTALLSRQHLHLEEQVENDLHYFYLHKKYFLDEDWFLPTFEDWQNQQITILGFNELEGNHLNLNKAKISIKVISGLNWFNTIIKVGFGSKKASLKHLHKAIRNKHKYVKLDDGTLGILPQEWIEKFKEYFTAGEVVDDETLQISKINFSVIEQLFDAEMLDEAAAADVQNYRNRINDFKSFDEVEVPKTLNTKLRDYQKQGLNWLNFLDDFNFGGCLADDMGLGKTIQVIAFILHQNTKVKHNVNLLVVPTSLIFNWKAELKKFAPTLKVLSIYGNDRIKSIEDFDHYQVVITSYGTLLSDINYLKNYQFNYIFLDESQQIKNPDSQRYKAVRLLQSRNKIVITGTPIENNTFDLYGQLSFACPGLLGSKQYFKDIYSAPIDMFKSGERAKILNQKIRPFILRRNKAEVAAELPEKTEMVLYCEMGAEQRRIYEAYEKEFRDYISATTNEELKKNSMNVLTGLAKLRQICDSPVLLKGDRLPGNESSKIDILMERIVERSPYHKILVFSQFVSMLDLIKEQLIKQNIAFSYLTGSTRNREVVVNEFQNNPDIRVFLMSMKAGGVGLNLTEADEVYLVDPWWNPSVENQAIDRSHRIGQHKNVMAVRLICPDTIEEKILELQERKKTLFKDVIPTETSFVKALQKDDLLQILSH